MRTRSGGRQIADLWLGQDDYRTLAEVAEAEGMTVTEWARMLLEEEAALERGHL